MKDIFVGWDGGGTGTTVACLDVRGNLLGQERFGPLNVTGATRPVLSQTIQDCTRYMARLGICKGLCIGTAGISDPRAGQMLCSLLLDQGISVTPLLRGDHEIALAGAVGERGAILIAGTGSICFGKDGQGNEARAGGFGHLLDDEGSGYAIGRDILSAVLRAWDGRGASTLLTGAVEERLGAADPKAVVAYAYDPGHTKADIAALAPLLGPGAQAGDEAALSIVQHASSELFLLAKAVFTRLAMPSCALAMTGSIFENCHPVREATAALVRQEYPAAHIIPPRMGAAMGAAFLALHHKQEE